MCCTRFNPCSYLINAEVWRYMTCKGKLEGGCLLRVALLRVPTQRPGVAIPSSLGRSYSADAAARTPCRTPGRGVVVTLSFAVKHIFPADVLQDTAAARVSHSCRRGGRLPQQLQAVLEHLQPTRFSYVYSGVSEAQWMILTSQEVTASVSGTRSVATVVV